MRWIAIVGCLFATGCATLGRPVTLPTAAPSRLVLSHVPPIAQTAYQCGPAALASVFRGWGRQADVEAIGRELRMPGARGVLNFTLARYAREQGFWTDMPDVADTEALREWVRRGVPPIILLQVGPAGLPVFHFVVVTGFDERSREFYANTGRTVTEAIPERRLATRWRRAGYWILIACPSERVTWSVEGMQAASLARLLEQRGAREQAARWYETALRQAPASVPIRFNLATLYLAMGRRREAKTLYQTLVDEQPGWSPASNNLAWIALQEGAPIKAIEIIQQSFAHGGERTAEILDTLRVANDLATSPGGLPAPG